MPTPSKIDAAIDAASEECAEALGKIHAAMHSTHGAIVALNSMWSDLVAAEKQLRGRDGLDDPGPLFLALEALREDPSLRRKVDK